MLVAKLQLRVACCALLCLALAGAALWRSASPAPQSAAADQPACWTNDAGRYMVGGGVLHCPSAGEAVQLTTRSDLSYNVIDFRRKERVVKDFNSPLILEAFNVMLCWIPKNR